MLQPYLIIAPTKKMGRGVFTTEPIDKVTIIEIAPVIVLPEKDRPIIDQTLLHDYIFEWDTETKSSAMALGYIPIYNHSYSANCEYEMDFAEQTITITTIRDIKKG